MVIRSQLSETFFFYGLTSYTKYMSQSLTIDERFDQLEARLDEQFSKVNAQFEGVQEQFSKVYSQIDRLAVAVVQGFERIDKSLEDKADKADMQRVYDYLDKVMKQQEINDDERLIMGHQLERLDRWVHEVAAKIGYDLVA